MVSLRRQAFGVMAIIGIAAGLQSCRDDEQGRPMVKQKGVYEGQADEPIDQQRLLDLKTRANGQKF